MPRQKPSSCIGCALHSHGTDFSAVTGTGSLGVMIVAEASGEHEQREGIPLVPYAPAGSLLERTFKRMGLSREQFVLTNCLRCFPGHVVVEATHVVNGFRRWYGGELVTIETDEGVLSGTPNHPALTNYGWIPLGLLQEGDYLIRGSVPERVTCRDPHIDWDSTRLDETFNSLANNWGSCGVIGSDMDFHGDGEDSEVDVVCPDRLLWDGDYLPILQKVTESALKTAHLKGCVKHGFGSGLCGPSRLFGRDATATDGIVSSLRNGLTSYKSRVPQSYYHGLATVAWPDAQSDKTLSGGLWTDAELYREALQTFSRDVTCSQIRKIERGAFSGHVYNLHTASEVYTANGFVVHNCRPKNNWLSGAPWEYSALRHCRPNLDAAIANRRPRAILAMGDVALRELTGLAGDARGIGHLTGYVLPQANFVEFKKESVDAPIPVIPAFHPAFIRRGKASYQGQFARCLSRAVNVASGKDHHYIWDLEEAQRDGRIRYQVHPSLDQARSFAQRVADNRGLTLSYDIETFESASLDEDARDGFTDTRIRLIQFSLEAGTGIAFPWDGEYRELAGRILRTDNVKCGHNLWLFDNKVLRAAGEREGLDLNPRGTIHDTLQCLRGDTKVRLIDGSMMFIRDIVENRLAVTLMGMDSYNRIIPVEVTNYHKRVITGQTWIKIKTDASRYPIVCTPDHKVFTARGWVTADAVKLGDSIPVARQGSDDLIWGTILGDAYVDRDATTLHLHHGKMQEGWIAAKCGHLGVRYTFTDYGDIYAQVTCAKHWRDMFYDADGKKRFLPPPSDAALAVWYMDDGHLTKNKIRPGIGRAMLCAFGFTNSEDALSWARLQFGDMYVKSRKTQGVADGFMLVFGTKGRDRLFDRIAPFVHPSMEYKLPERWRGKYNGWLERKTPQWGLVERISVPKCRGGFSNDIRYCVTVNHSTHRFFAVGGLVANCFHHWQPDLPAHLQFAAQFVQFPFPWKHLAGTDLEFYGCVDVDATLRLDNFLLGAMQRDQIWEGAYEVNGNCTGGYVGQMAQVRPVLAGMEDRGLPVDDAVRLGLDKEFESAQLELLTELDGKFPDSARSIHPKEGYKKVPKDTTGMCLRAFESPDMDAAGNPTMVSIERWCRLEQFSPNSSQQLIRYMKAKGHKIPKSRKSENEDGSPKDTTEKKELVRLAQRHSDSFYLKVIEYRELGKMRGTYIDGFKPHEDGRVHTTFAMDTGTGQISSKNPNITNIPKRARLSKQIRSMFRAPEGHEFAEADFKSCHVLTTGYCAEDADYMRLARLDMHSFVAGHFLHCWDADRIRSESDGELIERFTWFKSDRDRKRVRDNQAKPSILGIGFGMGYRRLYQENLEHFDNETQAKKFHDLLRLLFPKVFAWQDAIRKQAHEQTFLRSPFGHIRRFYEVFRWDSKRGGWAPGDQAEEAVAFLPANLAFGHIRETLLKGLRGRGLDVKYSLCDSIHDSGVFMYPCGEREQFIADVVPVLQEPSRVLRHSTLAPDGLRFDVEIACGPTWAHMQEVKLGPLTAGRLPQDVTQQAASSDTQSTQPVSSVVQLANSAVHH